MPAGRLRERATFQEEVRTPDGGGYDLAWADRFTVPARLMIGSVNERLEAGRLEASGRAILRVRYSPQARLIKPAWRVIIDGVAYQILAFPRTRTARGDGSTPMSSRVWRGSFDYLDRRLVSSSMNRRIALKLYLKKTAGLFALFNRYRASEPIMPEEFRSLLRNRAVLIQPVILVIVRVLLRFKPQKVRYSLSYCF